MVNGLNGVTLVDPQGRPLKARELVEETAPATLTGVRNIWAETTTAAINPASVARILRQAALGYNYEYLGLAEEMEEREAHYGSVLGTRKRALEGIDPVVVPASKEAGDQKIADAVSDLFNDENLLIAIADFQDALGKGFSAVAMQWDYGQKGGDLWRPASFLHRDPRMFQFDKSDGRTIRFRSDSEADGVELSPAERYSFVFHVPRLKSGLPARSGLARFACWCFLMKTFTMQDWMAFSEVYGMPLRIGRYDSNIAKAEEKRTLLRAVRDLGSDAAAIIPKNMEIELIETRGSTGGAVFKELAEYIDGQLSKIVLGQTMTTDNGSSMAQAKIHNDVRLDILASDAKQLAATLTRDIIVPFVAFNFGPQARYPRIVFPVEEAEDMSNHADVLSRLVPLGLRVREADVRERMGYEQPDEGDAILTMPQTPQVQPALTPGTGLAPERTQTAKATPCRHCGEIHMAMEESPVISDEDEVIIEALSHHQRDMAPLIEQLNAVMEEAEDFDDFVARLQALNLDTSAIARRMAIAGMKGRALGDRGPNDRDV